MHPLILTKKTVLVTQPFYYYKNICYAFADRKEFTFEFKKCNLFIQKCVT